MGGAIIAAIITGVFSLLAVLLNHKLQNKKSHSKEPRTHFSQPEAKKKRSKLGCLMRILLLILLALFVLFILSQG